MTSAGSSRRLENNRIFEVCKSEKMKKLLDI